MNISALRGTLPVLCCVFAFAPPLRPQTAIRQPVPPVTIRSIPAGGWSAQANGYTAVVDSAGLLSSLIVGGAETVGEPFAYQPGAKLAADGAEVAGDTLTIRLRRGTEPAGGPAVAAIAYRFRADGLTITPTWKGPGYAEFRFTASPGLLGIELLNDKSVTRGGDATQFVTAGEIRGVPAVASSRNQMVRFRYPGFGLRAYAQAWGAPFNYESAGSVEGRRWGRNLLDANRPFPIHFTIEPNTDRARLPALPFVPRTDRVSGLYYRGEPCAWRIDLGAPAARTYLTEAGVTRLDLSWTVTDFHDREVARGKKTLAPGAARADGMPPSVTLKTPGTGYYQAHFRLSDPAGVMQPSTFRTRFTVINRRPGMVNRDDGLADKPVSPYAIMGMIGLGALRESHGVGGFFTRDAPQGDGWERVPGSEPAVWMNTKRLDEIIGGAAAQSARYKQSWFFQANDRPDWATPALYEAMAFALVARYKDRCRVWEVENEPNFRYSPPDWVTKCLIPFARGAKRADPNCTILGPACVGVKDTLRFMEHVYAVRANVWLDGVATHTYPGPGESWEQFGNVSMIRHLRQWMVKNGDGAKPLWQTEQGYRWDNSPRARDARYAVRQFLQGWRLGIPPSRQYYFYPDWHGFESWYLAGQGEEGSRQSWTPLAAALRFLAENTHGLAYVGDVPSPYRGVTLVRFSGPNGDVIAAWTWDFACTLRVRADKRLRIVDFMGNPVTPARGGTGAGAVTLSLTGEPAYLHVPKGSALAVADRAFGPNLALAAAGAKARASSEAKDRPAALANDGIGELWEDVIGLPGRTAWKSGQKDPTAQRPDVLEVAFSRPRTIDRIVALCYLPAVNPSPRDWKFQVETGGGAWKTVGEGKNDSLWALHRAFAPVTAKKIRLVVTKINDGWHYDRRWMHVLMGPEAANYTESQLLVSELEAYGPPERAGPAPKR